MNATQVSLEPLHPYFDLSSSTLEEKEEEIVNAFFGSAKREEPNHNLSLDETRLIQAIKSGDEVAFNRMIDLFHSSLLRLARTFLASEAIAEEVVQDTWVCVLEGIHRFEGRSSLKTWVARILINQAKTRAVRESRYVPFPQGSHTSGDDHDESAVDSCSFHVSGSGTARWKEAPLAWDDLTPDRLLLSKEIRRLVEPAIQSLPQVQRQVIILRDVEGMTSSEVCQLLMLTETNQRVLLHRARGKVRKILEEYYGQHEKVRESARSIRDNQLAQA